MSQEVDLALLVLERADPDWREYVDAETLDLCSIENCVLSQVGQKKHKMDWGTGFGGGGPYTQMKQWLRTVCETQEEFDALYGDAFSENGIKDEIRAAWLDHLGA